MSGGEPENQTGGFYEEGALRRLAINLFYGWGYNFYRKENQLRADDQLIRNRAGWLLGLALAAVQRGETEYRRAFMPTPSRAHPYPEAAAVAGAQALERLGREIDAVAGRLHTLPAPENDRMTQRYREEAATLQALIACDEQLIGLAEQLRTLLEPLDGVQMLSQMEMAQTGLTALVSTLARRQALLI